MAFSFFRTLPNLPAFIKNKIIDAADIRRNTQAMTPKSKQELEGLLQHFPDVYRHQMGHDLDINKVKAIIGDLIEEREDFIIRQRFLDLPPTNLKEILTMLEPPKVEPETLPKKRGPKPKVKND